MFYDLRATSKFARSLANLLFANLRVVDKLPSGTKKRHPKSANQQKVARKFGLHGHLNRDFRASYTRNPMLQAMPRALGAALWR